MNEQELKNLLSAQGLSPKHRLGQNFLSNEDVLFDMADSAEVGAGDLVIEIGPGIANLTNVLLDRGARVFAIEKDTDFENILLKLKKQFANFDFVFSDALAFDFKKFIEIETQKNPKLKIKVVANIPYYITGKLIRILVDVSDKLESLTLLVQKEVAQNLTADPGDLSLPAISLQICAETNFVRVVSRKDFLPAPKVDSGVVHAKFYHPKKYLIENEKEFFKILKAAFLGKRKQIHNTLKNNLGLTKEIVESALTNCKIKFEARPEQLSIQDWINLYTELKNSSK